MSTARADGPGSADEASRLWVILTTPVWHLGHRPPTVASLLAASELPPALRDHVSRVVRRTRLWSNEKAVVTRELIAHFEDGLERGVVVEALIADFGEPRALVRLIRRAKRRCRPLWYRALTHFGNVMLVAFGLLLAFYAYLGVRTYSSAPVLARNYWRDWNASAEAVPPAERAAPRYSAAMAQLADTRVLQRLTGERPGDPNWPVVEQLLDDHGDVVDEIIAASALPRLGLVLQTSAGATNESIGKIAPPDNPMLIGALLPDLSSLRNATRLLRLDVRRSLMLGDHARVTRELRSMVQIARQVGEVRFLIGGLVQCSIAVHASDALMEVLVDAPQAIGDDDLIGLAHGLAALTPDGRFRIDLTSERDVFDDVVQRVYTDEGGGDGVARPEWLISLAGTTSERQPLSRVNPIASIAATPLFASRRDLRVKYDQIYALVEHEEQTPLWQKTASESDRALIELNTHTVQRVRYLLLATMMPTFSTASRQAELSTQVRDAALVAIALELYRRSEGDWPSSLNALVPHWLPMAPRDRYDGGSIKYCLADGRPLLYSVGADRDDDGGRLPESAEQRIPTTPTRTPSDRNRWARQWIDPDIVRARPAGALIPDGDWVLWPTPQDR